MHNLFPGLNVFGALRQVVHELLETFRWIIWINRLLEFVVSDDVNGEGDESVWYIDGLLLLLF